MNADDPNSDTAPTGVSQALLQAAALGERNAVRTLLSTLAPDVARVCAAVLGHGSADVDDAVQESLLALLRALPRYRGECSVARYANRIAVRTALHHRRRERGKLQRQQSIEQAAPSPEPLSPGPDELFETDHRRRALLEILAELPPSQAETLALRVVLGCSLRETADATGVPVNTVRSRLRLARESLRERILNDTSLADIATESGRQAP